MQVCDAIAQIDHGEIWLRRVARFDRRTNLRPLRLGEAFNLVVDIADAVVGVGAHGLELGAVLAEDVLVKHLDNVSEYDGVRHFHHRRLHMQRQQHTRRLGLGDLLFQIPMYSGEERSVTRSICGTQALEYMSKEPCKTCTYILIST